MRIKRDCFAKLAMTGNVDSLIKSENDRHEAAGKAHPTDTAIRVCRGPSLAGIVQGCPLRQRLMIAGVAGTSLCARHA